MHLYNTYVRYTNIYLSLIDLIKLYIFRALTDYADRIYYNNMGFLSNECTTLNTLMHINQITIYIYIHMH